jgi:protein N-terminal amidase
VGYPEKAEAEYYNSLVVISEGGDRLANYRKSFLYYTDVTWAREGPGFYGGKLGSWERVAMGICECGLRLSYRHPTDPN